MDKMDRISLCIGSTQIMNLKKLKKRKSVHKNLEE